MSVRAVEGDRVHLEVLGEDGMGELFELVTVILRRATIVEGVDRGVLVHQVFAEAASLALDRGCMPQVDEEAEGLARADVVITVDADVEADLGDQVAVIGEDLVRLSRPLCFACDLKSRL